MDSPYSRPAKGDLWDNDDSGFDPDESLFCHVTPEDGSRENCFTHYRQADCRLADSAEETSGRGPLTRRPFPVDVALRRIREETHTASLESSVPFFDRGLAAWRCRIAGDWKKGKRRRVGRRRVSADASQRESGPARKVHVALIQPHHKAICNVSSASPFAPTLKPQRRGRDSFS